MTLNQHLILLTKIENKQFAVREIFLNRIIQNKLEALKPLIESANLHARFEDHEVFSIKMLKALAEILVNNLLSNAIRHNYKGGNIRKKISRNGLEICNTGKEEPLSG